MRRHGVHRGVRGMGEVAMMRGLRWRWVVPLVEEEVVTKLKLLWQHDFTF